MSMKNKFLLSISALGVIMFLLFANAFGNLFMLLTARGYYIPDESNLIIFHTIQMNKGSGEWWLHGEDKKRYYANLGRNRYLMIGKDNLPDGFLPTDKSTWGDNVVIGGEK